jgi:hypothetical protein
LGHQGNPVKALAYQRMKLGFCRHKIGLSKGQAAGQTGRWRRVQRLKTREMDVRAVQKQAWAGEPRKAA